MPEEMQGMMLEWLVAQELVRRFAINGDGILDPLTFWQIKNMKIHYLDNSLSYRLSQGKNLKKHCIGSETVDKHYIDMRNFQSARELTGAETKKN